MSFLPVTISSFSFLCASIYLSFQPCYSFLLFSLSIPFFQFVGIAIACDTIGRDEGFVWLHAGLNGMKDEGFMNGDDDEQKSNEAKSQESDERIHENNKYDFWISCNRNGQCPTCGAQVRRIEGGLFIPLNNEYVLGIVVCSAVHFPEPFGNKKYQ